MSKRWLRILFFLLVVQPVLIFFLGMNVFFRQRLPKKPPFILIANHNSHLDACALMNLFPLSQLHAIHPAAAEDYFMANPLFAWISTTFLNIIPIPRTGISKTNNPLVRMGEVLEQGHSLIVFPEGSRGEPEVMSEFKTGIAHLIKKYPGVPVLPVFLKGMGKSLPKGEFILVPFFCDAVIGEPVYFSSDDPKEKIVGRLEQELCYLAGLVAQEP